MLKPAHRLKRCLASIDRRKTNIENTYQAKAWAPAVFTLIALVPFSVSSYFWAKYGVWLGADLMTVWLSVSEDVLRGEGEKFLAPVKVLHDAQIDLAVMPTEGAHIRRVFVRFLLDSPGAAFLMIIPFSLFNHVCNWRIRTCHMIIRKLEARAETLRASMADDTTLETDPSFTERIARLGLLAR